MHWGVAIMATQAAGMNKIQWIQWTVATAAAGISGAFALMAYNYSTFVGQNEYEQHQNTVHVGAVTEGRYLEDLRDLRSDIRTNSQKLDRILEHVAKGK
jgi:hypothetical protein